MKRNLPIQYPLAAIAMVGIILDSRQTLLAAAQGVELCIRSVIPSLFPFFVLSGLLVPGISKIRFPPLGRLLRVPKGWESVFLLSCVGGYPVGAQCICQGYRSGQLTKAQAERMLGFCNNCGPAFLFGIVSPFFPHPGYAIGIMISGILSAILVAFLWPGDREQNSTAPEIPAITLPQAVKQATASMSGVCAWIFLGKILVHGLQRFLLPFLPASLGTVLVGMLELTNGCFCLTQIPSIVLRFTAASMLCAFGGLCVAMQVSSICSDAGLSIGSYLPQKLLQGFFSAMIALALATRLYPQILLTGLISWFVLKTAVAFRKKVVYNGGRKGGFCHAVPKEN